MIRLFDILFSVLGLVLLLPLFLILYLAICIESRGGGFYRQVRVGKDGKDFKLYKFRSMRVGADAKVLLPSEDVIRVLRKSVILFVVTNWMSCHN